MRFMGGGGSSGCGMSRSLATRLHACALACGQSNVAPASTMTCPPGPRRVLSRCAAARAFARAIRDDSEARFARETTLRLQSQLSLGLQQAYRVNVPALGLGRPPRHLN